MNIDFENKWSIWYHCINENNWTGKYFETVPIKIKAIAKSGFSFSHCLTSLYFFMKI